MKIKSWDWGFYRHDGIGVGIEACKVSELSWDWDENWDPIIAERRYLLGVDLLFWRAYVAVNVTP